MNTLDSYEIELVAGGSDPIGPKDPPEGCTLEGEGLLTASDQDNESVHSIL